MWQFLAKILSKIGTKVGEKALEKGGEQVIRKGAQKLLEKGAAKVGQGLTQQAVKAGMNIGSGIAAKQEKPTLSKILNVLQGTLGRNDPKYGQPKAGGYVGQGGDILMAAGAGNIDKVKKAYDYQPQPDLFNQERPKIGSTAPVFGFQPQQYKFDPNAVTQMAQPAKNKRDFGKTLNNVLGGESLGSKMLLNTLYNLGSSGAFRGSDVGEPDRNFLSSLANSSAAALGQSVMQQREQDFNYRNDLLNMLDNVNVSEEIYSMYSPRALSKINQFQGSLAEKMAKNRTMGVNRLTSEDLMQARQDYTNIKKEISKFNESLGLYREAEDIVRKDTKQNIDLKHFQWATNYFRDRGYAPAEGFIKAAPKDPRALFPQLDPITPISQWSKGTPENGFMRSGNLTEEQRRLAAVEQLNSNPGVRRWAEENGYDPNNTKDQIRFGMDYGDYIEQPFKDDYSEAAYKEEQARLAERRADKATKLSEAAEKEATRRGWVAQDGSVVFTKEHTENVSVSDLSNALGVKLEGASGQVIPVRYESLDSQGRLTVVYPRKNDAGETVYVRASVQPNKARNLVEPFYPGAWEAANKLYKAPSRPVGVDRTYNLQGVGQRTYSELKAAGWSDEDIKRLE